jgi:polysaccharide biosynthesis protein PelD
MKNHGLLGRQPRNMSGSIGSDSRDGKPGNLTDIVLGKLTSTSVRPAAMLGEILLLPLAAVIIGSAVNAEDPLLTAASFPWTWFAPTILALRYGPLAGLGGAGILLAAWLALNTGHYEDFPKLHFLGGLILVMLVGEFSSLWLARTRRAETMQIYLDQRLEHLTHQHYLLRLSHDRLEQDLISRPMSMRDALHLLQAQSSESPTTSGLALLRLLAQYCQLESATFHRMINGQPEHIPVARIGTADNLRTGDPLVEQALDTHRLCHVGEASEEMQQRTRYLIAAPAIDLNGDILGLLTVEELPFFALQDETLQTINLLLSYYADGLAAQQLATPIQAEFPDCPQAFAFEMQRLWHLRQATRIPSVIVALRFQTRAIEADLPLQIMRLKRGLDEYWLIAVDNGLTLATLMPLGEQSSAEGYIARLEQWAARKGERTLSELGVFPHVLLLNSAPPREVIQHLLRIAHAAD